MRLIGVPTLGDLGRPVARLDEDVASLGAEGCSNGLGESLNALEQGRTAFNAEPQLLIEEEQRSALLC